MQLDLQNLIFYLEQIKVLKGHHMRITTPQINESSVICSNSLFRLITKKTSKLHIIGLFKGIHHEDCIPIIGMWP